MDTIPIEFEFVDHINMFVKNLDDSMLFYEKLFGTDGEVKESGSRRGVKWAIIGIPNKFYFCLYELKDKEFDPDAMHINHIGFFVKNFEETYSRIKALGIPIQYKGKPISWINRSGTSRSLYIDDPNGYKIEFVEKVGGGLDEENLE